MLGTHIDSVLMMPMLTAAVKCVCMYVCMCVDSVLMIPMLTAAVVCICMYVHEQCINDANADGCS